MIKKAFYILLTLVLLISGGVAGAKSKIHIDATFCENKPEPLGVNIENIRFSWKMSSPERSVNQTAYQILLSEGFNSLESGKSIVWDSGKTNSDQSILVAYKGAKLKSGTTYYWKVKVWDNKGTESEW